MSGAGGGGEGAGGGGEGTGGLDDEWTKWGGIERTFASFLNHCAILRC